MTPGHERNDDRAAAAVAAFGRWLSHERELRALRREEVVRLSGLPPAAIAGLESGDPQRAPQGGYAFAHLRVYASVVGLDPDDVVLRWQEVVGPEDAPASRRPRIPLQAVLGVLVVAALAVLTGIALFGGPRERAPLKLDRPRAVQRAPYATDPSALDPYAAEPPRR